MLTHNGRGFQAYRAVTERSSFSTASDDSNVLSHNFLVLALSILSILLDGIRSMIC
jgi:hypothetical protein